MKKEVYRLFAKSKICLFLCGLLFAATFGFGIFFVILGMTGFSLLHTIARYNYYLCFLLSCLTYYYVSGANRNDVKEISESRGMRYEYEKKAVSLIVRIVICQNLGMCLLLVIDSLRNDGSTYFLSWFWENYLWNVTVPQLICVGVTFFAASSWKLYRWFLAEVCFLFLISPFAEDIVWPSRPLVPVDQVWKILRRPFEILYQNGEWSPDFQNDFQLETVRILVLLFWGVILIWLGICIFGKRKRWRIAVGITAAVLLLGSYLPASVYRLDQNWDGINSDITWYGIGSMSENTNGSCQEEKEGFYVEAYDLEVSAKNELSVKGRLELKASAPRDEFRFTLYHGYRVRSVSSMEEGITAKAEQEGDCVTVKLDRPVTSTVIQMSWKGHHDKFYSNARASLLPGWFPWYPMAGEKKIVLEYPEYGGAWGYNPYNRIPKAKIRIRSERKFLTNLTEKETGVYEGEADSITLLSGNLEQVKEGAVKSALPLSFYNGYGLDEFSEQQQKDYTKALEKLERSYGIDTSELSGKALLFASKDMGRNVANNFLAVFDNYILVAPDSITADTILHYLILKDAEYFGSREATGLVRVFIKSFFEDDPDKIVKGWEEEVRFQMEHPDYFACPVKNPELFLEILEEADSEQLVKEAVRYLLSPEEYGTDLEFLKKMRGEI